MFLFQFRDFLLIYNRMTEMCFKECVNNLNYRDLTPQEVRMIPARTRVHGIRDFSLFADYYELSENTTKEPPKLYWSNTPVLLCFTGIRTRPYGMGFTICSSSVPRYPISHLDDTERVPVWSRFYAQKESSAKKYKHSVIILTILKNGNSD